MSKKFLSALALSLLLLLAPALSAEPLYSPTWGFGIDLPEGYQYAEGNSFDRYSFHGPNGAKFDMAVYKGTYRDVGQMADDINRRLGNSGGTAFFEYCETDAALLELNFMNSSGWGLCLELADAENLTVLLLALAYAPAGQQGMDVFHLSALDSIVPAEPARRMTGPIMEFGYPRGKQRQASIAGTGLNAVICENDAEAAQELVDREYALLTRYQSSPDWQEAWIRFYRAIYRDSWGRLGDAVLVIARNLGNASGADNEWAFAEKTLAWVQGFQYERDPQGSDFVNLVTAATEGRGDCDSRAMLWAMLMRQADITSAIMVSPKHSHAMGLADIAGGGARFESHGIKWVVAETTVKVGLGLIAQDMSDTESWIAVIFE